MDKTPITDQNAITYIGIPINEKRVVPIQISRLLEIRMNKAEAEVAKLKERIEKIEQITKFKE